MVNSQKKKSSDPTLGYEAGNDPQLQVIGKRGISLAFLHEQTGVVVAVAVFVVAVVVCGWWVVIKGAGSMAVAYGPVKEVISGAMRSLWAVAVAFDDRRTTDGKEKRR